MRLKGIAMAAAGCVFWGGSGIGGQFLLHEKEVGPEWLSVWRMLTAGLLLLAYDAQKEGGIWALWRERQDRRDLLLFGAVGMMGTQYTYFAVIDMSNAAVATVLQYLMPVLVVFWYCLTERRHPYGKEIMCAALAVAGVALIATKGNFQTLAVSPETLLWGLASAVFVSFYTVEPKRIIRKSRASLVVGWGLLTGGLSLLPFALTVPFSGICDGAAWGAFAFVVIFGTVLSFTFFLGSLSYLDPREVSILAAIEPVSSILFSALLFGMVFTTAETAGMALIIFAVGLVTYK